MRSRTHGTPSRRRRTAAGVLLLALVATAVVGCGDDEPDAQEPASSATSASSTGDTTEAPTGEPTPDGPAPATGELIEQNALHINLTDEDWLVSGGVGSVRSASISTDHGTTRLSVGGLPETNTDLDAFASDLTEDNDRSSLTPRLERQPNRTINGVEVVVFHGKDDVRQSYLVAGLTGRYQFTIQFRGAASDPDTEARLESMLASIEWQ